MATVVKSSSVNKQTIVLKNVKEVTEFIFGRGNICLTDLRPEDQKKAIEILKKN